MGEDGRGWGILAMSLETERGLDLNDCSWTIVDTNHSVAQQIKQENTNQWVAKGNKGPSKFYEPITAYTYIRKAYYQKRLSLGL